jgi:Ca-activated chloride channel family protein
MSEVSFTHAELWPCLLLALPFGLAVWWLLRLIGAGREVYGAELGDRVSAPWARATRVALAAVFLFLAYMEPRYGEEKVAVERRGLDIVFAMDTSRSMLARDMNPSRLAVAKRDVRTVLPSLTGGDRVGFVAFAGEARLVVPLTHDLGSFRQLIDQVDTSTVRKGGTDLAAAIRKSLQLVGEHDQTTTVVVLMTDGEDLTGAGLQAAREAKSRGVVVHAVGYGSTKGSKITLDSSGKESFLQDNQGSEVVSALDSEGLRRLAESTGGEFLRADVMALPLVQLKTKRLDPMVKRAFDEGEETVFRTRFQWALIPAMLLLVLELLFVGGSRR